MDPGTSTLSWVAYAQPPHAHPLQKIWEDQRASYLFIPSLMCAGALGLGVALPIVDAHHGDWWIEDRARLYANKPEGRRVPTHSSVACHPLTNPKPGVRAKLLTEFIGTFFLVLTIGLAVLVSADLAPVAIGAVLTAMVYMGGHISGAHYNPAVTLAVWLSGKMEAGQVAPYMAAQLLGGVAGALVTVLALGDLLLVQPGDEALFSGFFALEFLFAFALCLVILNVAFADATAGNGYFGIAIGLVVMAGAFAAGPISGAAFNPAVAVGPIMVDVLLGDGGTLSGLWVYLVATFAGGALSALAFRAQHPVKGPPVAPHS